MLARPFTGNACRLHKASGQAVVTIAGEDHYLGRWKSRASVLEYDRLIGEWLTAGRPTRSAPTRDNVTIAEVCSAYWKFAQGYYVKNGKTTSSIYGIRIALRFLRQGYGHTPIIDFGPLSLKALQQTMIAEGHSRRYINDNVDRIRRVFKWAASEEMLPSSVYQSLKTVSGLRKGRSKARELPRVTPVADDVVEATLPHLQPVVADMVRFQRLTGCRPTEACILRPCDLDVTGDVWKYRPARHKTEHHDRERIVLVGSKVQEVLRPYLLRDKTSYCFSPAEGERKRRAVANMNRLTPQHHGNRPGTNRKIRPKRTAGNHYTKDSYRQAIHRACDKAFTPPDHLARREDEMMKDWHARLTPQQHEELKSWQSEHRWSPNQLRHAAATEIRSKYGVEAAQNVLGHSNADVTQIYAERDLAKAEQIMREVG